MLHVERQRLKAVREAEARGESFWTAEFSDTVRTKIHYALVEAAEGGAALGIACEDARQQLLKALGRYRLSGEGGLTDMQDFLYFLQTCPDEMFPSVIEATLHGLEAAGRTVYGVSPHYSIPKFASEVKTILERHRISWDIVGEEMIELKSKELHSGVVEPAVRLLAGRPDLTAVEHGYQEALRKVSQDEPENAITDAGTALQEMLRACGCKGNGIGDLAADARKKGLLVPHDSRLAVGIQAIMEWVGADRSLKGDSHLVADPSNDDAWLIIHVVGALIVRLAAGKR